jgi:hypothetical protein
MMRDELTPDQWREIVAKAIEQALDGNPRARTRPAAYVMGQPVQRHSYRNCLGPRSCRLEHRDYLAAYDRRGPLADSGYSQDAL